MLLETRGDQAATSYSALQSWKLRKRAKRPHLFQQALIAKGTAAELVEASLLAAGSPSASVSFAHVSDPGGTPRLCTGRGLDFLGGEAADACGFAGAGAGFCRRTKPQTEALEYSATASAAF